MPLSVGPDIDTLRERALHAIDMAAGEARLRFVSPGALVAEEYRQAASAVEQWRAAGSPADTVPQEVIDGAAYSGISDAAAADEIEQTATVFAAGLRRIREQRLTGKRAVRAGATGADIAQARNTAIQAIAAIAPPAV